MKYSRLILQAEQLLIEGNFEAAKDILTDLILKDSHNPELYYLLADALCKLKRFEDAITFLRKANRLLPKHPRIIHLLGWALFMNGEPDLARVLMEKSLKTDPENEQIYSDLAVLEMKTGNLNRAKHLISLGKQVAPDDILLNEAEVILNKLIFISKSTETKKKFN